MQIFLTAKDWDGIISLWETVNIEAMKNKVPYDIVLDYLSTRPITLMGTHIGEVEESKDGK